MEKLVKYSSILDSIDFPTGHGFLVLTWSKHRQDVWLSRRYNNDMGEKISTIYGIVLHYSAYVDAVKLHSLTKTFQSIPKDERTIRIIVEELSKSWSAR